MLRITKDSATKRITVIDSRLKEIWARSGVVETSDEAANIGPAKKLSELFNVDMDTIVKFFIFVLIIVFDPLGVLLVVQFNKLTMADVVVIKKEKKKKKNKTLTNEAIYNHIRVNAEVAKTNKTTARPKIESVAVQRSKSDSNAIEQKENNTKSDIKKIDKIKEEINVEHVDEQKDKPKSVSSGFTRDVSHKGIRLR